MLWAKKHAVWMLAILFACTSLPAQPNRSREEADLTISCLVDADSALCRQSARQILESTVHYRFETWQVQERERGYSLVTSDGHGTVVNGRYLITHHHHTIPLSLTAHGVDADLFTRVVFYDASGALIRQTSLAAFRVAAESTQVLVLEYTGTDTQRPFGVEGLSAAQIDTAPLPLLAPGSEVAQVDWDGRTTHVDWVLVEAVCRERDPDCLRLQNEVQPGASGGGVFWHGRHVAVTWLRGSEETLSGETLHCYSMAVINETAVYPDLWP